MKKKFYTLVLLVLFVPLAMLFSACGKIEFKIKFIVDGQEYAIVNTAGNETISMPDNPTKEEYEFDGWYWDNNVWQEPFTANSLLNQPLNSDMKVYAKWNDSNELKGTNANFINFEKENENTYKVSVSNSTEILNFSDYVEIGNNSSWQLTTDIQGSNTIPSKIATLNIGDNTYYVLVTAQNSDVKLYTLKIRRRPIYVVSFGEFADTQYIEENSFAIQPNNPSKKGYTFGGWNFDFSQKILKNEIIEACWTANTYSLKYNSNNKYDIERNIEVTYDYNYSIPNNSYFELDFYNLTRFNTKKDGTGISYYLNSSIKYEFDYDLTLYAIWSPTNYTINYHYNNGNYVNNPRNYNVESDDITLLNTNKDYYSFDGWYTESEYINKIVTISNGSHGNLNLYAKFTPINYNINYNCDSDEVNHNPAQYNIESNFVLIDAEKDYYNFNGWYKELEFTNQIYEIEVGSHGNIDIFPKFTPIEYTITVHLNGGNKISIQNTYNVTTNTIILPKPTRDYYEFSGWYLDDNFEETITEIQNGSHSNYDIYAKWQAIEYSITYNLNGGILNNDNPVIYTVEDGIELNRPIYDGKEGYWCIDYVISNNISIGTHGDLILSAYYNYDNNVFNIDDVNHLLVLSHNTELWEKEIILKNDIDLENVNISPIGTKDIPFTGTFDGQQHSIINLTIDGQQLYCGLFGVAKNSSITDLSIINANTNFIKTRSGGILIGEATSTNISKIYVNAKIEVSNDSNPYYSKCIGGIIGTFEGSISNSYANIIINGKTNRTLYCGGIVGICINSGINMRDCYVTGSIGANANGYTDPSNGIYCYAAAGGLIGNTNKKQNTIYGCQVSASVGVSTKSGYGNYGAGYLFGGTTGTDEPLNMNYCYADNSKNVSCSAHINYKCTARVDIASIYEYIYNNWDTSIWNLYLDKFPTLK